MGARQGKVVLPAHGEVWPHELETAKALAATFGDVEFIPRVEGQRVKSPDIAMLGMQWEMKSPRANDVKALQRILRRAGRQSPNVVVDTSRMKGVSDAAAEKELRRLLPLVKSVRRLVMVNKRREALDLG